MQTKNHTFKHKSKTFSGVIVWPESLQEALIVLPALELWEAFKIGYLELCRRRICEITQRRRTRKIDVSDLPEWEQALIQQAVLETRAKYHTPQTTPESAPLESLPTTQTDSVETQAAAQDPVSSRDLSFEEDFARYSAALGS